MRLVLFGSLRPWQRQKQPARPPTHTRSARAVRARPTTRSRGPGRAQAACTLVALGLAGLVASGCTGELVAPNGAFFEPDHSLRLPDGGLAAPGSTDLGGSSAPLVCKDSE